jgi:M6 family metalloprotease-like protein
MNYNNGSYDAPDEEVEAYWSDLIFGEGGSFEDGEASVNDFFKDMSGGKFWWDPILLGDNTTGVYSFHFDKDYDWENTGQHPEWPIYEFTYDTMITLESLAQKGLDMSQFALDGMNNENYPYLFGYLWDGPQSARNPQWYTTSNIMCIFPPYNFAGNEYIPLSSAADSFAISVHLNMNSSFGVVAHELAHCLGAVDVYRWGYYSSDLMSYAMNSMPAPYYVSHINPFYKIIWGWVKPRVVTESCQITLYPPTSDKYEPVIVRTSDPDQYYILENRQSEKFDFGLEELFGTLIPRSDGLNIWRIDKLGCEAIYNRDRKGISLEVVLRYVNYRCQLWSYTDSERIENISEGATDIIITYVYKNPDGSVVVDIDFNG